MGDNDAHPSIRGGFGHRLRVILVALVVAAASLVGVAVASPASALSGSAFNRGDIISDSNFFSSTAMSQSQIQAFLDKKCPTKNCINVVKSASTTEASNSECPGGYAGLPSETTAAILYKVQHICGVSARVLLVTLQKEQGLVTAQNPSAGRLRAAMGYACPDTAPCSSSSLGFFRQVYDAAWQFQEYRLNAPNSSRFPVGQTSAIRKSPNSTCKSINVVIHNQATRGLYIYTPYTPDAAALGNLGGLGDDCSSYGNRNFWVYYSTWFGSPTAGEGPVEISAAYSEAGGVSGALGAIGVVSPCAPTATVCSQVYAHGVIYWGASVGVFTVAGATGDKYLAAGGVSGRLGAPISAMNAVASPTTGNGSGQSFQHGQIVTSAAGTFVLGGAILTADSALGWVRGALGWPTSDAVCTPAGSCSQTFQAGLIVAPKTGAALTVSGAVATKYASVGGMSGALGVPVSANNAVVSATTGNGFGQSFEHGQILTSSTGTFIVTGTTLTAYSTSGWVRGALGWPTSDAVCTPAGVCSQSFHSGMIVAPKTGAAYAISGAAEAKYLAAGGLGGALGTPVSASNPIVSKPTGNGSGQSFQGGQVLTSKSGTWILSGAILKADSAQGWVRGALGWPLADAVCSTPTVCSQSFQHGKISVNGSTVAITH